MSATMDRAAENATNYLRQVHTALADKMTPTECQNMLEDTGEAARLEKLDAAISVHKSMVILWAMQTLAGGYLPEDCEIAPLPKPDGTWHLGLTCKVLPEQATRSSV